MVCVQLLFVAIPQSACLVCVSRLVSQSENDHRIERQCAAGMLSSCDELEVVELRFWYAVASMNLKQELL